MYPPRLLEVAHHDYSGISGYADIVAPDYTVTVGEPGTYDYKIAELYADGTIRLIVQYTHSGDPEVAFSFNPKSNSGIFADMTTGIHDQYVDLAKGVLISAGIAESLLETNGNETKGFTYGDPLAGRIRTSAHHLTDTALRGLQFSRWFNYEYANDPDVKPKPGMERENMPVHSVP
jgi:hypothetical protein